MEAEELKLEGRKLAGRYLLQAEVAAGGMGTVWRARDEVLGRQVAVKVLHDHLARDPDLLERFRLEAIAAARLSHPAVVRVFDTGVDDGTCYIVMELFDGTTVEDVLANEGPLAPGEAARIIRGALQGLAHAHNEGVVHRDVKPANILVDDTGLVKVTDFGIAKAAFTGGDLTTTGSLLGTARYLAPEQVTDEEVDARADLYSAGLVLFELLTGRGPFEADTHIASATMRLTRDPVSPRALRPGIPRNIESVVMRALAREPADRFQSAEEMGAALDRSSPPVFVRRGRTEPERDPTSFSFFRSWLMVPLALVALAALGFGSFIVVRELLQGGEEAVAGGGRQEPLEIVDAFDHDPQGDGSESPDSVDLAFDGDEETSWTTERYNQANLGGIKDGVGIALDLGEPQAVAQVRIRTGLTGWTYEIYAADEATGDPIQSSGGETSFTADEETETVALQPVETQFVLIWVTELAQADDGFRAQVNDVDLFPPRG